MAQFQIVNPADLPAPRGYNHGVFFPLGAGGVLFVAGQVGWDRDGRLVSERFAGQFEQALVNVLAVVRAMGGRPESIGKLTIFVADKAEYLAAQKDIGQAYRHHMGTHFPAMSLVEVHALLEPGARVEIEGIAVL